MQGGTGQKREASPAQQEDGTRTTKRAKDSSVDAHASTERGNGADEQRPVAAAAAEDPRGDRDVGPCAAPGGDEPEAGAKPGDGGANEAAADSSETVILLTAHCACNRTRAPWTRAWTRARAFREGSPQTLGENVQVHSDMPATCDAVHGLEAGQRTAQEGSQGEALREVMFEHRDRYLRTLDAAHVVGARALYASGLHRALMKLDQAI